MFRNHLEAPLRNFPALEFPNETTHSWLLGNMFSRAVSPLCLATSRSRSLKRYRQQMVNSSQEAEETYSYDSKFRLAVLRYYPDARYVLIFPMGNNLAG